MRLVEVRSLQVNEASLTGESLPISKNTLNVNATALGDQKNMLFSGTIITTGTAIAVVVGTGSDTEIGKIAHLVAEVEEEQTPMQRKLDDLGRKMGALILFISIIVFVIIFFVDQEIASDPLIERLVFAFTVAVALAVAAIPEGLSFVVRISLALGARRMAGKNALVRKLSAVEALGSTDVIASDKTGTLTKGEMTVREIFTGGDRYQVGGSGYEPKGEFKLSGKTINDTKKIVPILQVGILCNNSSLKDGAILGDPTEGALVVSAMKAGLDQEKQNNSFKRVDEVPFSSERKMMTTVHRKTSSYLVATKGAPDLMLNKCSKIFWKGKVQKLTPKLEKEILKQNEDMAKSALRVLGFAYKEVRAQPTTKNAEKDLIFLGLQGMMDPPREEVKEVMHRVHSEAGMRVLMITGDYIETAKAVAKEIGIEGEAISGSELDELSQEEFEKKVEKISVYARVNPEHKIRIVQALKKNGHQVAMTGDGVNDAPAIKAADIGIAMGINGTDAAKEASDLILLDDQFLTIINAIEEGRGIFDNVRKFVSYLLGANIAEVLIVLGGIIMFKDPILTATQLLFINIVTDGLPAVALGSDPAEKGTMNFKPHHFQSAIINKQVWVQMFAQGFISAALLLWQFWYIREHTTPAEAVAVAFTALVIYELVWLVVLRTNYDIPWLSNPWLTVALVSSVAVQLAVIYVPKLAELFGVAHVSNGDWLFIAGGSAFLFGVMKVVSKTVWKYMPETNPQFSAEHYDKV
jgi:Ca2+-transporting ATPase